MSILSPDSLPLSRDDHFQHLLRLMALEAEAEAEQIRQHLERFSGPEAERTGQTLVQLVIRAEDGGLGGRSLLTFGKRNVSELLPWHRLRVGTPVLLSEEGGGPARKRWRGVVSQSRRENIQVAFESWPEPATDRATFRLDVSDDEIGRRRERAALNQARTAKGDRLAALRRVLLLEQPPEFGPEGEFSPLNPSLNPTQQAAVRFALSARDVAIIHGPPGTGKTTTVVELIRQALRRGERVLACAPSNIAVDNIFERLLAAGEQAIRLGHPARVLPELRGHTLDLMVENHPDVRTARKLARESYALRDKAGKYSRAKPAPGAKREMRSEAKAMLADARRLEAQTVERILDAAQVLCVTTTGLSSKILGARRFDLCVLDEAAQSTEPGTWIPLLRSERIVLAGDHCQLPPTIISREAAQQGFGISLMERLMTRFNSQLSRRLTLQYRMHRQIMAFSSAEFYDDQLEAEAGVAGHLLADLPGVANIDLTATAVYFIDTAGAGYEEAIEPDGESRLNPQEAALVEQKTRAFIEAGVSPADIAVITPYAAQVRLLREILPQPGLEIDSVDGFQGREKEAVIISLVRSNPAGEIGFLADTRRMNVALSRARRKLLVIGDSATISSEPFYQRLVEYFELIGAYQSVWEELEW